MRVLLLGGTTEASTLARSLKSAGIETVFSYAGRTNAPVAQPVETRVGGFGGVAGLVDYLQDAGITHVVDATHPFAAQMSRNAHGACAAAGVPLIRLERPAWEAQDGDDWFFAPDIESVCDSLPYVPSRIFLAIGRMHVDAFARQPQHHYILRLVDAPTEPISLPCHSVIIARGPFDVAGDIALMRKHRVDCLVAKNAGGVGAAAKLAAARELSLPVVMVNRPALPRTKTAADSQSVLRWLGHSAERGV